MTHPTERDKVAAAQARTAPARGWLGPCTTGWPDLPETDLPGHLRPSSGAGATAAAEGLRSAAG